MSQIQLYHVTHIPDYVSYQRQYLSRYQHHHVADDPRSVQTLSSVNDKYQHYKNLTKIQKTTSRSQKSKLHQSVRCEHRLLIEQVKEQKKVKVKATNKQFNKAMRERRLHYLFLLNQQEKNKKKIMVLQMTSEITDRKMNYFMMYNL